MIWEEGYETNAKDGDLALLVGVRHKYYVITLREGKELHTHRGVVKYDDLIGKSWGSQVFSHMQSPFFLLKPSLTDLLKELPRNSQILYPKDIGFILLSMGIGPGKKIIEAGTGSGALTSALAYMVGNDGHIFSYESNHGRQKLARKNLERLGLQDRVTLKLKDIGEGFDEDCADALFLDVQNPFDYIQAARKALKPGGFFGSLQPTANQVSKLLLALEQNDFAFIEICEILLRYYRPDPTRLRPSDRMIAHTGFLIFARPMIMQENVEVVEEGELDQESIQ
ncbi:MAG: tRNA (adenine-N1)-methyltransferase [Anaerolineaceae bacterium]|nr:tRNA (adenine-N1)-methyltransferase [Anaerolineaceae bacterium]